MFFKEIGFHLQEIKEILDSPQFDRKQALLTHKELLLQKKKRLEEMIRTLERTIDSMEGEIQMSKQDLFDGFDMKEIEEHQKKYAEEIRVRYGVDAMGELSKHSEKEWARIMARSDEIYKKLVTYMDKDPAAPEVQQVIGAWRQHISDNFYPCTLEIFRGLGDMYVADERFTANIDKYAKGLAAFMKEAMHIYCDNHTE
ncbi:MerR family transcriptional regulator [Laceyella putida]|uniref:TipAS antibiotic-recognition domain-containing protein n=1 Tax=Laceyella putida TaxID=110101 RepID=A0ABW2RNB4_9BACL